MECIADQNLADELLYTVLDQSRDSRALYVDLEADNFYHYKETLCTVQISVSGSYFLLDAIHLDLSTVFTKVLKEKEVWLHGSDYDLYLLRNAIGVVPEYLQDSQVAARLCGYERFGYGALVEQLCGVKLPKDSQRSDWTKRPIANKMLKYAENDVRYLPQISDILLSKLDSMGRLEWFQESCAALVKVPKEREESSPKEKWRIPGSNSLTSHELCYLKSLYEWRDKEAQKVDKPHFKVLNNLQLLDWATSAIINKTFKAPRTMRPTREKALMEHIEQARSINPNDWPEKNHAPPFTKKHVNEKKLKSLIQKRNEIAKQLSLEQSFIASKKTLEHISVDLSCSEDLLLDWQRTLLDL